MAGCRKLFVRAAVPDTLRRTVHICGPTAMAAAAQQMLHHLGVEASHIEVEAFGGKANAHAGGRDAVDCEVKFMKSGKEAVISSRATLLDAALAAGVRSRLWLPGWRLRPLQGEGGRG